MVSTSTAAPHINTTTFGAGKREIISICSLLSSSIIHPPFPPTHSNSFPRPESSSLVGWMEWKKFSLRVTIATDKQRKHEERMRVRRMSAKIVLLGRTDRPTKRHNKTCDLCAAAHVWELSLSCNLKAHWRWWWKLWMRISFKNEQLEENQFILWGWWDSFSCAFFEAIYFFLQPTRTLKIFDRCGAQRFHSSAINLRWQHLTSDIYLPWESVWCCQQVTAVLHSKCWFLFGFYLKYSNDLCCLWIEILIDFKASWNLNCTKSLFSDWKHRLVIKF